MDAIIPSQWVELFKGLDVASLAMLTVIAFALKQSERITDAVRVVLLLAGGALFGIIQTIATYGPETPLPVAAGFMAKGILMNAGGAYLLSFASRVALEKLGAVEPLPDSKTDVPVTPVVPPKEPPQP